MDTRPSRTRSTASEVKSVLLARLSAEADLLEGVLLAVQRAQEAVSAMSEEEITDVLNGKKGRAIFKMVAGSQIAEFPKGIYVKIPKGLLTARPKKKIKRRIRR